jgi:ParB-like chromosome segregation protein Spo0J
VPKTKPQKPKPKQQPDWANDMLGDRVVDLVREQIAHREGAVRQAFIELIRDELWKHSGLNTMPIDRVRWVPVEKVTANDYNPNSVARNEMRLLYTSIDHDGYTQPIVAVYDPDQDLYVIVDGFHRYLVMKTYADIAARTGGLLPVVVIAKSINDRMASTVRHNRARGKHSTTGMASMVFEMLDNGMDDASIFNELGLEQEELVRLKHVTGFSKLFENYEYRKAWETKDQLRLRQKYEAGELDDNPIIKPFNRKEKEKVE